MSTNAVLMHTRARIDDRAEPRLNVPSSEVLADPACADVAEAVAAWAEARREYAAAADAVRDAESAEKHDQADHERRLRVWAASPMDGPKPEPAVKDYPALLAVAVAAADQQRAELLRATAGADAALVRNADAVAAAGKRVTRQASDELAAALASVHAAISKADAGQEAWRTGLAATALAEGPNRMTDKQAAYARVVAHHPSNPRLDTGNTRRRQEVRDGLAAVDDLRLSAGTVVLAVTD